MDSNTRRVTNGEFVSLKEHFESRFDAMDKALELAQKANDARLAGMNEFREALKDQTGRLVTRSEADATRNQMMAEIKVSLAEICADIEVLQKYQATMEGKASQSSVYIAYIIASVGIIITVIDFIMHL